MAFCLRLPVTAKPQRITRKELFLQLYLPGGATIICALLCYLFTLEYGGIKYKWSDSIPISLLVGWILLTFIFVIVERFQEEHALVPGRLMQNRGILACYAFIFW